MNKKWVGGATNVVILPRHNPIAPYPLGLGPCWGVGDHDEP